VSKGDNIIHFPHNLNADEHGWTDTEGVRWGEYFAIYRFDDKVYSIPLWAKSQQDADARFDALCKEGYIAGKVVYDDA
jgi:hypothetical protein